MNIKNIFKRLLDNGSITLEEYLEITTILHKTINSPSVTDYTKPNNPNYY